MAICEVHKCILERWIITFIKSTFCICSKYMYLQLLHSTQLKFDVILTLSLSAGMFGCTFVRYIWCVYCTFVFIRQYFTIALKFTSFST